MSFMFKVRLVIRGEEWIGKRASIEIAYGERSVVEGHEGLEGYFG